MLLIFNYEHKSRGIGLRGVRERCWKSRNKNWNWKFEMLNTVSSVFMILLCREGAED